jgi:dihydrofolate reductase
MANVLLDISISLDGIMAVNNNFRLHQWYFRARSGSAAEIKKELVESTGAIIMGRNMFDLGNKNDGFVDSPYKVPHFVLSHSKHSSKSIVRHMYKIRVL